MNILEKIIDNEVGRIAIVTFLIANAVVSIMGIMCLAVFMSMP